MARLVSVMSHQGCGIYMHRTIAIVAASREHRLVETSRMDKRCVVQLTDFHKLETDLLTRT
jgi:predicted MPP superfamily phosphohydrolase